MNQIIQQVIISVVTVIIAHKIIKHLEKRGTIEQINKRQKSDTWNGTTPQDDVNFDEGSAGGVNTVTEATEVLSGNNTFSNNVNFSM